MQNERLVKLEQKVREMRIIQKEYFKGRGQSKLMQARRLEKEVDELLEPPKPRGPEQGELFKWIAK